MEAVERFEQAHCVAHAQLRMTMAVAERHHLHEELDVHQTAVALLDVEPRLILGADLHLHSMAHRGYLADLGHCQSAAVHEFLARRFHFAPKFAVSRYHTRAHQRLPLPYSGTLSMILTKAGQRRDQRARIARRTQAQVELVGVTLARARFEDR